MMLPMKASTIRILTIVTLVEKLGGKALPCQVDVRSEEQILKAVKSAADHFGGIDVLVNNASIIALTNTASTSIESFDSLMNINLRGTFAW